MTKNALLGLGGYEIAERGLVPIKVQHCMALFLTQKNSAVLIFCVLNRTYCKTL